jgi:hypothetical protein
VCLTIARVGGPAAGGDWQPVIEAAAVVLYIAALLLTGVITQQDREAARRLVRQVVPSRWARSPEIEEGIRQLPPGYVSALEKVIVQGWSPSRLAAHIGLDTQKTSARLVGLLRRLEGESDPTEHDARIGEYLFDEMTIAEHDEMGRSLWEEDVEPADIHSLEGLVRKLQGLPNKVWVEAGVNGAAASESRRWRIRRPARS